MFIYYLSWASIGAHSMLIHTKYALYAAAALPITNIVRIVHVFSFIRTNNNNNNKKTHRRAFDSIYVVHVYIENNPESYLLMLRRGGL